MSKCPCGSGNTLAACCGPILSDEHPAATPETLMRSRYTAYAMTDLEHLLRSTHPDQRANFDEDSVRQWSENATWEGLEILDTSNGAEGDETGTVEFIASFTMDDEEQQHHEIASFSRVDDRWYFVDGRPVRQAPVVRSGPKIGRNDPCPCGSGRKFKKCCG